VIDRRTLLAALACATCTASLAVLAQDRMYRVGIGSIGTNPSNTAGWQPFHKAMLELGYVEGRNLQIRQAFGNGDAERTRDLMADLVRRNVDVMVVTGIRETRWARELTSTIPIVMLQVGDPVAQGFVTSLARPGGNVTGLTSMVPGLSQKHVGLLREILPLATRLAVIARPDGAVLDVRSDLEVAAKRLGISLQYPPVHAPGDFDTALQKAKQAGVTGIIVPLDALTIQHRQELVRLALKHRLPGIYWDRRFVEAGGLVTYSPSLPDLLRRCAIYVDKILKGAKPADLPVEQPTKFELVINLKTAKALGITIPQSLLLRADEVIE
jgi:putative tryptophan/tyrosine transport system substrate-binding protein